MTPSAALSTVFSATRNEHRGQNAIEPHPRSLEARVALAGQCLMKIAKRRNRFDIRIYRRHMQVVGYRGATG